MRMQGDYSVILVITTLMRVIVALQIFCYFAV